MWAVVSQGEALSGLSAVGVTATDADRDQRFVMDLSGGSVSVQPDCLETHKS